MPDNKPMTPEEFAKRLAADKYISLTYEQRIAMKLSEWAESIRREAKREMLEEIINAMVYFFDTHEGTILKSGPICETLIGRFRAIPIDTPPAAEGVRSLTDDERKYLGKFYNKLYRPAVDRAPESFMQELAEHKIQPDEITESDIRKAAPEADYGHKAMMEASERVNQSTCSRCDGKGLAVFETLCPDCHGTGKQESK